MAKPWGLQKSTSEKGWKSSSALGTERQIFTTSPVCAVDGGDPVLRPHVMGIRFAAAILRRDFEGC